MMKLKKILLFMSLLVTVTLLRAATPEDSLFVLKNGGVTMTIDVSHGGKILSLKHTDQEILSQSRWPESFGSTFWTSPQKEWNWPPVPEFDKKPYRILLHEEGRLVIKSPKSERLGMSVSKDLTVDTSDGAIVATYSITNESDEPRRVAPWEISRVKNDNGLIFFEAQGDSVWPSGLMSFDAQAGAVWYRTDEAPRNRKVNADGKGWLAFYADSLLLVKCFQDLQPQEPAPDEAEVQVYVNRGKTYIELESQGTYTLLEPGEELKWSVRWYLLPVNAIQPEELMKAVRGKINR